MTDAEMIKRMRQVAMASIHSGWATGDLAWLLKVADRLEELTQTRKNEDNK